MPAPRPPGWTSPARRPRCRTRKRRAELLPAGSSRRISSTALSRVEIGTIRAVRVFDFTASIDQLPSFQVHVLPLEREDLAHAARRVEQRDEHASQVRIGRIEELLLVVFVLEALWPVGSPSLG